MNTLASTSAPLLRACLRDAGWAASTSAAPIAASSLWQGGWRSMAVAVEVKDNRVQQALAELNRKREEAGIPEELRKRRYHIRGSEKRYEANKRTYKHAVGQVVSERIKWVMQRRSGPSGAGTGADR
ncbi:hypothetical protein HYH03_015844 [Edaphochlamys debaryana]|uniref:Mitochondrial ribosomal protein S21 n=1 Tax=Edaphochlamys debaryana TaxID=47281 RepID=A0A835XLI0_9CHLO|nr:hypothetical protein HYH03_015844 [Edaphochlamys debaryana]|eukprot:KAG2485467.1 hypothetical protein HYH03_015844 [Edaphochlamys debaryana]